MPQPLKTGTLGGYPTLGATFGPPRGYQVNGHDLEYALSFYVRKHKGFGGMNPEPITKSLYLAIEAADLAESRSTRQVRHRVFRPGRDTDLQMQ